LLDPGPRRDDGGEGEARFQDYFGVSEFKSQCEPVFKMRLLCVFPLESKCRPRALLPIRAPHVRSVGLV